MRKIIESTLVSLDGVTRDPHLWITDYFDSEAEKYALELLSTSDAMLMGKRTYEFFATSFPRRTGEYGERVNGIRKYVFSSTLKKADWSNSYIVKGDVATNVAKLKSKAGKDLVIYGHGLLAQTLLTHHLLDELKLWIHPCFVGHGKLLFREGEKTNLKLIAQKTLATGVIVASYQLVTS
jgi:dihydrofolate reductase